MFDEAGDADGRADCVVAGDGVVAAAVGGAGVVAAALCAATGDGLAEVGEELGPA